MRFVGMLLMLLSSSAVAAPRQTYFLSPDGNDNASGTRRHPLATLGGAQKKWRAANTKSTEVEVVLRGGDYPLAAPLELSGEDPSPLWIHGAPGETVRLIGQNGATSWREGAWNGQRAWFCPWSGAEPVQRLYVAGRSAPRARWPKTGLLRLKDAGSNGKTNWGEPGTDHFTVEPADFQAMGDPSGAEVVALHFWVESRLPVESYDLQTGAIVSSRATRAPLDWGYKNQPAPYYVENARGALREAGEWIHDVANKQLVYLPRPGETLPRDAPSVPLAAQLLRIEGSATAPVKDVRFENISFAQTSAPLPFGTAKTYENKERPAAGSYQAAVEVPGVVSVAHARGVSFQNCRFSALGWNGLALNDGSQNVSISKCRFLDLGAGGLTANGSDANGKEEDRTKAVTVSDCTFERGGRVFPSAVALLLRHVSDSTLDHNTIHDFFYTAISIGWSWGYGPSVAKNNHISHNHIWNLGQGILSDMGGVYLLGLAPGTRVENNWIHDVQSANYGGWGIYLDEGSSDVVVRNNVVARCSNNAFHQHYGANNTIENNIFIGGGASVLARTRVEDHLSLSFARNIFVSTGSPIYSSVLPDAAKNIETNRNVLWSLKAPLKATFNESFAAWQKAGRDTDSRVADPLLRDVEHDNFDLTPSSPALGLGFQPWNWRDVGAR